MKLELVQDGVVVWTRNYGDAVLPGAPLPVVMPPSAPVPAGWTLNTNPVTYEPVLGPNAQLPFDINTQLSYRFRAGPNQINVHPIKFDAGFYTGMRAALSMAVTSSNLGNRDYAISLIPGSMTAVSPYGRKVNQGLANVITISFTGALGYCPLTKGVQYYLNVKASAAGVTADYLLNATPL